MLASRLFAAASFSAADAVLCINELQSLKDDSFRVIDGDTLIFRGTKSWQELLTEARVGGAEWEHGGKVHRGFVDLYSKIRPDVIETLQSFNIRRIAGHSVGGIFAVLASQELRNRQPSVVYTFGSPKIGSSKEFARHLQAPVFRVANTEDLVTRLPPLCQHVGVHVPVMFETGSVVDNHMLDGYAKYLEKYKKNQFTCGLGGGDDAAGTMLYL